MSYVASLQLGMDRIEWTAQHNARKLDHLAANHPEVLAELFANSKKAAWLAEVTALHNNVAGALDASGPIVSLALKLYGAKLALALHWAETGAILESDGRIFVGCSSNEKLYRGGVSQQIFQLLPDQRRLAQGRKVSAYEFAYSSKQCEDSDTTAHWAWFSNALLYRLFVGQQHVFSEFPQFELFAPGCIQTPKPKPQTRFVSWSMRDFLL
ncbi:MAG: hypothetical protein AAF943_03525 [Pseudomonadota bacterium]